MKPKDLAKRLKSRNAPFVLDVRSVLEYRAGHIPGSVNAPFWAVLFHQGKLPRDKAAPVVITCEHGPRAQAAKSLLGLAGYRNLDLLDGHMSTWRRSGLPMEK